MYIRCISVIFLFIVGSIIQPFAQIEDYISSFKIEDSYKNILHFNLPQIVEVSCIPEKDTVKIIAKVEIPKFITYDFIEKVILNYSINAQEVHQVEMEQDLENENLWYAQLPKAIIGDKTYYFITAYDSAKNITTEINPVGFTKIIDDEDADAELVSNDLDILTCDIKLTDKDIYIKWKIEGKFSAGITSPPLYAHSYSFVILAFDDNLTEIFNKIIDKAKEVNSYEELLEKIRNDILLNKLKESYNSIRLFYYVPIAELYQGYTDYPKVGLVALSKNLTPQLDEKNLEYELIDNELNIRINRFFEDNIKQLSLVFITAVIEGELTKPKIRLIDLSNYVNLYLRYHSYEVGKSN